MPFISTFEEIGYEKGMQRANLNGIEAILDVRFAEAGTRLMPEIRQIDDNALLEKILQAAKTVAAPEDLREFGPIQRSRETRP